MKTKAQLLKIAFRLVLIGLANLIILAIIGFGYLAFKPETGDLLWYELWAYLACGIWVTGVIMLVIINLEPIKENLQKAKDHITFFWNYNG